MINYIQSEYPASRTIDFLFYQAKLYLYRGYESIGAVERIDRLVPKCHTIILEEPERFIPSSPFQDFRKRADKVIGILHTNYSFYMKQFFWPSLLFWVIKQYSAMVVQLRCDKIIHLSSVTADTAGTGVVIPLNGVSPLFVKTGTTMSATKSGVYTIGKSIWAKNYRGLIDLLASADYPGTVDSYGAGADQSAIEDYAGSRRVSINFRPPCNHGDAIFDKYMVFINASLSEVLGTTTMEAIAMGKWVIIPKHKSNESFYRFANVLVYSNQFDFNNQLQYALESPPDYDKNWSDLSWDTVTRKYLVPLL